ncbi:LPXTG cell wall anchor domain-containing protein [Staphylococcus shinii]|uniref:LPXTG cell wall anchor domain-containing protein n=1 Tax=Staphylococcus shinii TaxID=2912228 RepID=UPI003EE955CE
MNESESISTSDSTDQNKDNDLPETGQSTNNNGLLAGVLSLGGLALLRRRRNKDMKD